jgi:hypothetical protein
LDGDPDPKRIRRSKAIGVIADPNAVLELFARTRTSPPPDVETAIADASDEDPARLRDLLRDQADRGNRDRSAEPDDDARDVAGSGREPDEVGGDDLDRDGLLVAREPTTDPDEAVGDFDPDILTPELTAAMAEWQAAGWTNPDGHPITDTRADDAGVLPEYDRGRLGGQSWAWTRHPDTDPKTDRLFPRVTLVVHMSQATVFGDTRDPCRLEHPGQASVPLTTEQAVDLLGHSRVTVQPVIDLNHMAPVDGYEIRGRLRQAVFLKSAGVCPFPYCDTFSKYAQCDHTINWPRGPSALGNLAPPDPTHHRLKTHGDWLVQQPFPGIYVWKDPHGRFYLVDHTGSRPFPRSEMR